jgi:hypothetical protein
MMKMNKRAVAFTAIMMVLILFGGGTTAMAFQCCYPCYYGSSYLGSNCIPPPNEPCGDYGFFVSPRFSITTYAEMFGLQRPTGVTHMCDQQA